jgi:hypothetical protein
MILPGLHREDPAQIISVSGHEYPPKPTGIEAMVCNEIAMRQKMGINKYQTTVADNPLSLREWLQHQYEELLDAAVYCRRAIAEIDKQSAADGERGHDALP